MKRGIGRATPCVLVGLLTAGLTGCAQTRMAASGAGSNRVNPKVIVDAAWWSDNSDPRLIQTLKSEGNETLTAGKTPPSVQVGLDRPQAAATGELTGNAVKDLETRKMVAQPSSRSRETLWLHPKRPNSHESGYKNLVRHSLPEQNNNRSDSTRQPQRGEPTTQDSTAVASAPRVLPFRRKPPLRPPDPDELTLPSLVSRPRGENNAVNSVAMHFTEVVPKLEPLSDRPPIDEYQNQEPRVALSNVRSNGLVEDGDGRKIAILEVEGYGTYVAREGESIVLPGTSDVLRIRKISNRTIIVSVGDHGQEFVVQ